MQPTCSPPAAHRQPTGRRRELRARPLPSGLSSLKTQTWPGAFLINIPALFSIVSMVTAGSMQGAEEAKLIDAQPDRFPAPVAKYVKAAFAEWRSGKSGKPLVETLRGALDQFKKENENKGGGVHGAMLLEIGAVTSPSQNVDSVSSGAKQLTHGPRGQPERLA
mmetsp:Transcript_31858/g.71936  ORF Transcript_31858/g.71936 Transcript_31858/m.71936 type:complete len:164 (+) Transcript_31858:399-890(+)